MKTKDFQIGPQTKIQLFTMYKTHLMCSDSSRLKIKRLMNMYKANRSNKKPRAAILIPDKLDFKAKSINLDKGHFIILKDTFYIKM